ncbi:hypothetical protein RJ640_015086 [Escallonia rubra]|uniref:Retrotransposon gag domain-containing protein n=1 Tax=Escallonia rubra TaxID=112253 RepID=A0AA88ULA4_9ASTE|nr:hypothetical protein RJ640_015086 [Escallonia rubra]
MSKESEMSMMRELTFFLGLQIKQRKDGIFINQANTKELLNRFDMEASNAFDTPMSSSLKLDKDEKGKDVDIKLYRGHSRFRAMFPRNTSFFDLIGYSDADYAGCKTERKSTSGGCQFLGHSLISWSSKKQNSVALSSTEAEYMAVGACCAQILWMKQTLLDFGLKLLRFVGGLFLQEASRVPHTVSFVPSKATVCQVVSESQLSQKTVASAKRIVWDSLLRKTMANTKERIDALEAQVQRIVQCDEDAPGILKQISLRLDALEVNVEATDNARYAENMDWEGKFQELQDRVELLSRAVVNTPAGGVEHSSRPRVPEPKSYGGARDAKELENFLFDIEQYFRAIRVDSEVTKVSMAAMYLVGDAKLWWRKKYAEIEDGSCVINTWEILKRELKNQFFPENTAFNARKALLECKNTGSVREYCQAFSALMLDISDMSAVDRLFFFMEGLKPWARTELNRRRVNNLNEAIIAAESLSDYNSEPQRPPQRGNPNRSNGGKKPGGQAPNQSWGSKSSWASNSSTLQNSGVGFKAKPDASTSGEVKKPAFRGCFLCQGPHVIANCPQRQMMNAFFDNMGQVQRGEQSGSQSRHPPTEEQTDTQDYEEEDAVGAFPQWCNAVTTQVGNPEESSTGEKPKDMPPKKKSDVPGKGLMYVDIKVNGKAIRAMVDT